MLSSPHQRPGDEIEFSALQPLQSVGQPPASDAARERGRQWAISKATLALFSPDAFQVRCNRRPLAAQLQIRNDGQPQGPITTRCTSSPLTSLSSR
ncbi:hypothetical protein VTN96DRAFT_9853 [Rasamsonia emersonii]